MLKRNPIAFAKMSGEMKMQPYQRAFVPTDSDEPRCDITGQPLTIQQQFNQECG